MFSTSTTLWKTMSETLSKEKTRRKRKTRLIHKLHFKKLHYVHHYVKLWRPVNEKTEKINSGSQSFTKQLSVCHSGRIIMTFSATDISLYSYPQLMTN